MAKVSTTRGSAVLDRLREDILDGRWAPGSKLQPATMAELYGSSQTVMRESLTKLAGEKLVYIIPNRGFFVQNLSLEELQDLTDVRCLTETYALKLAIQRGDVQWESKVTSVHHRLSRTVRRVADDPGRISPEWADVHRQFHATLIEACNVPVLIDLSRQLADATELYRRWAAPSPPATGREVEREHAELAQAVISRDYERAARLLSAHYRRTVDIVLASGLVPGIDGP